MKNYTQTIEFLYESSEVKAVRFRYALLCFDLLMLAYLVLSSFFYGSSLTHFLDVFFGIAILLDFLARLVISKPLMRYLLNPITLADVIVIFSLLLPMVGENLAFLRIARMFRLLRSYHVMDHLAKDIPYFQKHRDIIVSSLNLFIFVFVMTALVFETQVGKNPNITNYLDALYFTIATLTTTGFGDVTMQGSSGKLIAVLIMIFGVSLFIRLIQTVFRPHKVRFECKHCALYLHDRDASHCKHCGNTIAIPDDGLN